MPAQPETAVYTIDNLPPAIAVTGTATAEKIRNDEGGWTVKATFVTDEAVDNAGGYAWSLRPNHSALADRLVRAIEAGVVFTDYQKRTTIYDTTYIGARNTILTRTMNADLTRLGY